MHRLAGACGVVLLLCAFPARPQVIEFEANGLKYQTLSKSGVTLMFATLAYRLRAYAVIQASVANGSEAPYIIRPEDFVFYRADGTSVRASTANSVVQMLSEKGGSSDVLKLVNAYELSLYGIPNMRSTNGYEQRRQAALLSGGNRFRAAAAAARNLEGPNSKAAWRRCSYPLVDRMLGMPYRDAS